MAEIRKNKPFTASSTGLMGVEWAADRQRWRARIKLDDGRHKWLGRFNSPTDAAVAYDAAAVDVYGDSAFLNFPANKGKKVTPIENYSGQPFCYRGHDQAKHEYISPRGTRHCRACNLIAAEKYRERKHLNK